MTAALVAWITAGLAALRASSDLSGCHIADSTQLGYDDFVGSDLVMLGDDTDDQGYTASLNGDWHDTGSGAYQRATAEVAFTVVSQSGAAATAAARLAALDTLVGYVVAALVPSPAGSNLDVATVVGAVPGNVRVSQVTTASGIRVAVAAITIRLDILA